jgi:hypothetical protein
MPRLPAPLPTDAPSTIANIRRNARAELDRWTRWASARDACKAFLGPHLDHGARVAIVGAGNGDDLPLRWLAGRAGQIDLYDVDTDALRTARRHLARRRARRVDLHELDITNGAADAIVIAARDGTTPTASLPTATPVSDLAYDLVVGDLFYSQLLAPAFGDLELDDATVVDTLGRHGRALTDAVVARLHASASGAVVHLHRLVARARAAVHHRPGAPTGRRGPGPRARPRWRARPHRLRPPRGADSSTDSTNRMVAMAVCT